MRYMGEYQTTSAAYLAVLAELVDRPEYVVAPRGLPCREVTDLCFTVLEPDDLPLRTFDPVRDGVTASYLVAEKELYSSGELRASEWARRASKFWSGIANEDGTVNSNYGHLVFVERSLPGGRTPWEWARDSLRRDPDTRQAYVRVALPRHQADGVQDQVCTLHLNFLLRGGRLDLTVVMRSNDVTKGLAFDMPWFCGLIARMAGDVGAIPGRYHHFAHSMHVYDRDLPTVLAMLGRSPVVDTLTKEDAA